MSADVCSDCQREKKCPLVSGGHSCSYCERWRIECEARALLKLPLKKRREELAARDERRGRYQGELRDAMARIHKSRRSQA